MDIAAYWPDDTVMERTSLQVPSTEFGIELMQDWPSRYKEPLSSDVFRGCVMVLLALLDILREQQPVDIATIDTVINDMDHALKTSSFFNAMSGDFRGGAIITLSNAWNSAHCGVPTWQAVAAYESEAIFAAQMFCRARRQEMGG